MKAISPWYYQEVQKLLPVNYSLNYGECEPTKNSIGNEFVCDACGKSYNRKGNLGRHKRYECGKGRQFQCLECPKSFFRKDKLCFHVKMCHQSCQREGLPSFCRPMLANHVLCTLRDCTHTAYTFSVRFLSYVSVFVKCYCTKCRKPDESSDKRVSGIWSLCEFPPLGEVKVPSEQVWETCISQTCLNRVTLLPASFIVTVT